jgi:hypothetical protein
VSRAAGIDVPVRRTSQSRGSGGVARVEVGARGSAVGPRGLWLAAGAVALAVGLAAGFGWVLEREERRLIEIERRARADAAVEVGRLRAERARLQARLLGAEERRRLEEEQAALVRLRAEVEAARKRTWPGGRP